MHLEKNHSTPFGVDACCWVLFSASATLKLDGNYAVSGNIGLFLSEADYSAGKQPLGSIYPNFDDITQAEMNSGLFQAIYDRVTTSAIVDSVETNVWTIGGDEVTLVDAVVH